MISALKKIPKITLPLLLLSLSCFTVLFYTLKSPLGPDSWLHMGIGRYIIENQHLPTQADLSIKQVDDTMKLIPHSWLSDIFIYLSAEVNPLIGVLLFLFPIFLISLYITKKTLSLLSVSPFIQIISLTLVCIISLIFWEYNPLIFCIPLLALSCYIYLKWTIHDSKLIWFIPLISLLWANLAGAYTFILMSFLSLIIINELIITILRLFLPQLKHLLLPRNKNIILVYLLSIIGTLISPNHINIWVYQETVLNTIVHNKWFSTLPGALIITNSSFAKNAPDALLYTFFLFYSLFIIFTTIVLLIRDTKKIIPNISIIFPAFICITFGYYWIRLIPITTFLTIPLFALLVTTIVHKYRPSKKISTIIKNVSYSVLLIFLLTILLFPLKSIALPLPTKQVDFITKNQLMFNILPSFDLSSYVYYQFYPNKGYLDASDDLFDEYDTISLYQPLSSLPKGFIENILSTYNINTIISSKNNDYLNLYVDQLEDWALVYLDYSGFIFIKKSSLLPQFIQTHELKYINLSRNLGYNPEDANKAAKELEQFLKSNPSSSLAAGQLATIYRLQKKYSQAEHILLSIPHNKWDFIVMTEMGRLRAAQGYCESSEQWFLKALKERHEQNISQTVLDLGVLYAGCFHNKEKATHYFLRYNSFPMPVKERERARQIGKDFGIALDEADK